MAIKTPYELQQKFAGFDTFNIEWYVMSNNNDPFATVGVRVFTYDCKWGTVETVGIAYGTEKAWHKVRHDDGSANIFDASRLSLRDRVTFTRDPKAVA